MIPLFPPRAFLLLALLGTAPAFAAPDAATPDLLLEAIRADDADKVRSLLARDELLPVMRNRTGEYPAVEAARLSSSGATLEALLDARAPLESRDRDGRTLLHVALNSRNAGAVRVLLVRGADVRALGPDGEDAGLTLLHASLEPEESRNFTTLMAGLLEAALMSIPAAAPAPFRGAIGLSPRVNPRMPAGYSGAGDIHFEQIRGEMKEFSLRQRARVAEWAPTVRVLRAWADSRVRMESSPIAFGWVACMAPPAVAEAFLDCGQDPNGANGPLPDGSKLLSPLAWAVMLDHAEAVDLLLRRGALPVRMAGETKLRTAELVEDAAWHGNTGILERILPIHAARHGLEPAQSARGLEKAMVLALLAGRDEFGLRLLDAGASHLFVSDRGTTPLHAAAGGGAIRSLRRVLPLMKDIDQTDAAGFTPLLCAIENGHLEAARVLLDRGAFSGARNDLGEGALELASAAGSRDLLDLLFARGLVFKDGRQGERCLVGAVSVGAEACVRLLWEKGARPPAQPRTIYERPVYLSASLGLLGMYRNLTVEARHKSFHPERASAAGCLATLRFLVEECGLDVRSPYPGSLVEPLHGAAATGDTNTVAYLLARGADIHARNRSGATPLVEACNHDNAAVVRLLLDKGASVDVRVRSEADGAEADPVTLAIGAGAANALAVLLEKGVPLPGVGPDGATPLAVAVLGSQALPRERRLPARARTMGGLAVPVRDHARVVDILLRAGADASAEFPRRGDVLAMAVTGGDAAMASVLLGHGVRVDRSHDLLVRNSEGHPVLERGQTTLHLACRLMPPGIVRRMLELGADPLRPNGSGTTCMQEAAAGAYPENAAMLVRRGVPVDHSCRNGDTALISAVRARNHAAVRLLMSLDADPGRKNASGESALTLGQRMGDEDLLRLLNPGRASP